MITPAEEMACATCLAPLNVFNGAYVHPLHRLDDGHPPMPVPVSQLDTIYRTCDFCTDPYPMWALTGVAITVQAIGDDNKLVQTMGDTWSACVPCMHDVDAGHPDRVADRLARRLRRDGIPVTHAEINDFHQAFLQHRRPGRTLITTTAWPDLRLHARDLPKIRDRLAAFYRGPDELPGTLHLSAKRDGLADGLDRARLYWIDDTFTDLAEHAAPEMPAVTVDRDLASCDDGLMVWSRPATSARVTAISWSSHDDALHIATYRSIGAGLDDAPQQQLREEVGWLAPTRALSLPHRQLVYPGREHGLAILLATWLLIAQKAAEAAPADIDKTIRKRYARTARPLPDVRIVRIRARPQQDATSTPTGTGRAYTNRVWVTGHWRNQVYGPRRALRRPVYIHPFLRGPADAPIKLSTTVRILSGESGDPNP